MAAARRGQAGAPTGPSPVDVVKAIYKSAIKADADLEAHPDAKTTGGYSDEAFRAKYFSTALRKAADGMDAMFLKYHGEILDWDPILASNGFPDTRGLTVSALKSDADSALVVASFGAGQGQVFRRLSVRARGRRLEGRRHRKRAGRERNRQLVAAQDLRRHAGDAAEDMRDGRKAALRSGRARIYY